MKKGIVEVWVMVVGRDAAILINRVVLALRIMR